MRFCNAVWRGAFLGVDYGIAMRLVGSDVFHGETNRTGQVFDRVEAIERKGRRIYTVRHDATQRGGNMRQEGSGRAGEESERGEDIKEKKGENAAAAKYIRRADRHKLGDGKKAQNNRTSDHTAKGKKAGLTDYVEMMIMHWGTTQAI